MARIPFSFYLSMLAGIFVLFNHYAALETGDVALNKVTGAAGRFYTLFQDVTVALQHPSRLRTVFCGPLVDGVLPHDASEYLREHYCHASDAVSTDRKPHGKHDSSEFASV